MNKSIIVVLVICTVLMQHLHAQKTPVLITGGTLHIGDGTVVEQGQVVLRNGVIEYAGSAKETGLTVANASIIDATGEHIYPGCIGLTTQLGLMEIEAARATRDVYEVGVYNPNVRSLIAYNTDSKVIPTVRSNGILLAQPVPDGGVISGQSSIMKLSGWNWEDAVVAADGNMHMHWPSAYQYNYEKSVYTLNPNYTAEVRDIHTFLKEAKAYCSGPVPAEKNLRFEAMRKVFSHEQRLFVQANHAKEIMGAVEMADDLDVRIVIAGGRQAYRVTELLKANQIPVLLEATQELPMYEGDPIDLAYRMPGLLTDAGILCGLTVNNEGSSYWNMRNLPFQAGNTVAYGMDTEQALRMITLNNARIAGIDDRYGSLTAGKSATLFISTGDALDMRTNRLTHIFISGEQVSPGNWQDDQERKYEEKYGITPRD